MLQLLQALDTAANQPTQLWTLTDLAMLRAVVYHYGKLHKKEEVEAMEGAFCGEGTVGCCATVRAE